MKEIFINFASFYWMQLEYIISNMIDKIIMRKDFQAPLNSLCWTSGCFSECLSENNENAFFIKIMKLLLN